MTKPHYMDLQKRYSDADGKVKINKYPDYYLLEKAAGLINDILSQQKDNIALVQHVLKSEDALFDSKDAGARAFDEISDEVVQTTSFVIRKSHIPGYTGTYQRLIDGLSEAEKAAMFCDGTHCYTAKQDNFSKIPGSPVAYSMSQKLIALFDEKRVGDYCSQKMRICTGSLFSRSNGLYAFGSITILH